jgi:hypothetical protein
MFILHDTPDTAALAVRIVQAALDLRHRVRRVDRAGGKDRAGGRLDRPASRPLPRLGRRPVRQTPDGRRVASDTTLCWPADGRASGLRAPLLRAPAPDAPGRAAVRSRLFPAATHHHPAVPTLHAPARAAGEGAVSALLPQARARPPAALGAIEGAARRAPAGRSPDRPGFRGRSLPSLRRWLGSPVPDHPGPVPTRDLAAPDRTGAARAARAPVRAPARAPARACARDDGPGDRPFTDPCA